jgi:hypothetical protein
METVKVMFTYADGVTVATSGSVRGVAKARALYSSLKHILNSESTFVNSYNFKDREVDGLRQQLEDKIGENLHLLADLNEARAIIATQNEELSHKVDKGTFIVGHYANDSFQKVGPIFATYEEAQHAAIGLCELNAQKYYVYKLMGTTTRFQVVYEEK